MEEITGALHTLQNRSVTSQGMPHSITEAQLIQVWQRDENKRRIQIFNLTLVVLSEVICWLMELNNVLRVLRRMNKYTGD